MRFTEKMSKHETQKFELLLFILLNFLDYLRENSCIIISVQVTILI